METKAKLPKKLLSMLLAALMIFSACYVGIDGAYTAYAAEGDSKYSKSEVISLINVALADGKSYQSTADAFTLEGDDGKTLAAAEAIFDYAVKTYRGGRSKDSVANSGDTLLAAFLKDFKTSFSDQARGTQLATAVLNPNGTTVYGYENRENNNLIKTGSYNEDWGGKGADVTSKVSTYASNPPYAVTKTVDIEIDVDKYLQTFTIIDDIPSSFLTSVSYDYAHTVGQYAESTAQSSEEGCFGAVSYTGSWKSWAWNYMSAKPVRVVTKNTTAKKYLKSILKFFDDEVLAYSQEDLLEMSLADLEYLDSQAIDFYEMMNDNFSDATLEHFDVPKSEISAFIKRLAFAHKVVAAKSAVDTMDALVGNAYNEESYSEMSTLYNSVNYAYGVVAGIENETLQFILNNYPEVAKKYSDIDMPEAKAYIDTLLEIMTEQRFEEMVNSMMGKYDQYDALLDRENVNEPTDPEVSGLLSNKNSWNSLLGTYTDKPYYHTYYTSEIQDKWESFAAKIDAVADVRGLKADYQQYYNYFYPIIYTADVNKYDSDFLMTLNDEMDTQLSNLTAKYNDIKTNYNETIAKNIFTINYGGEDILLQELVSNSLSAGKAEIKTILTARTAMQIDLVQSYAGVTTVNYDNFAEIKSTLSHFDYDLYDYVTGKGWLNSDYVSKYSMVQTLLDRYHLFSKSNGRDFFDDDFTFVKDGYYAIRYAGDQKVDTGEVDENGDKVMEQLGYPNDIARDGADDNYYVTEDTMMETIENLDNFITSRDFGALLDFYNEEEDEYVGLKDYLNIMLEDMLYNDEMINTLVGAIFPMICDMIANELVGAIGDLDGATTDDDGVPWLDLGVVAADAVSGLSGKLGVYLDTNYVSSYKQKDFPTVFKELGLYIFPYTLAESLAISNPSFYGPGSPIHTALTSAGRDWSKLVCEDDPDTLDVDETKVLEFEWGVYDQDSFIDTLACILDSLLPLLQTLLADKPFSEGVSNAAIAYSPKVSLVVSASNVYLEGGLQLDIPAINAFSRFLVPLFKVLGIKDENIPTLSSDCSGDDVAQAIFGTLLNRVNEILDAPLSSILEILPNLVYYLSMDSVQEILDALTINLSLTIHEVEVLDTDSWLVGGILDLLDTQLAGVISFDVDLVVADLINDQGGLYGLLGFELTNFNEVLEFAFGALGGLGGEEGSLPIDLSALTLPPIRQQEIIFCSEWPKNSDGSYIDDPTGKLVANKGDLLYWLLNYIVTALKDPALMNTIMGLLGSSGDGAEGTSDIITSLIQKIVASFTGNPRTALAAIIEVLNPVSYEDNLNEMEWVESQWNYNGIAGLTPASMIYLDYSNDWTEEKANHLVDNFDSLLATILELAKVELEGADNLGGFLQGKINALFTNENITKLVKMLGGLGDSPSAVINDVVKNQVGIDIGSWFNAFGYLFPKETWAEDAEVIKPTDAGYTNDFGVEGVANEDGTISWSFNKMPLVDGDGYTFVNILTRLLGKAQILIEFLFSGKDISAFAGVVKLIGYETFESTLGMLMEAIGVEGVPTQEQFNTDPMGSFSNTLIALLDWLYALTDAEDFGAQLLELIPDLFYYIESNGLSVLLHNLLMPVWVLVDTIRPLFDVNINQVISVALSEFATYGTLNIDTILQYVLNGIYMGPDDPEYVHVDFDIANLRVSDILKIVDDLVGTNLYESSLVQYSITGLCSGVKDVATDDGYAYKVTTVSAADAVTILVTGLLEALSQPAKDETKTNGEVLFAFIGEKTGNEEIAGMYDIIQGILEGIDVTYTEPNWGYMLDINGDINNVPNAKATISYLEYTTDWTEAKADALYDSLDELIVSLVPEFDGNVAKLVNDLLNDKVYSDANLNMIVEAIVNLFAGLNKSLFELVDVLIDTDIASWFAMCEEQTDAETGETKLVCTKKWGVDAASDADKRDIFVAALEEVLAPADALLDWLLFGGSYEFFTGAEKDEEGNYTYNDVLVLAGGEGYDRGIVPLFKALGVDLAPASTFATAVDGVMAILNGLFDLVDSLTTAESTVEAAIQLIPNLIYFLNADGVKVSVNNLLGPVASILEMVGPLLGDLVGEGKEISLNALLGELPIDITDITTETVLALLTEQFGIQFEAKDENGEVLFDLGEILSELYVGEFSEYTYAGNLTGYVLDLGDAEYDVLTLVIGFALELFKLNGDVFAELLGEEGGKIVSAIISILEGYDVTYTDIDWGYMYNNKTEEGEADVEANLAALEVGFPAVEFQYLRYSNDWTEETAAAVYDALDNILDMVLPSLLGEENENLKQLVEGLLAGSVYTDANLEAIVELIVNALAGFDANLRNVVGIVLDANIDDWFGMCTTTTDAEGNTVYEVPAGYFGVDAAADKKAEFVSGIKEILAPANKLLSWLFFGEEYTFFKDHNGEVIITLKGGKGYTYGLVPIFEALGCTMQPEINFYNKDTYTYDVGAAVEGILNSVLALLENLTASSTTVEFAFTLIPNLLYFINAGGLNASVSNLLAPVNGIIPALKDVVGADNVQALLSDLVGFNLSNLSTDVVLGILESEVGFKLDAEGKMLQVIKDIYALGSASEFDSANGKTAYKVDITGREYDVLTVILSFALDALKLNKELFAPLFGEEIYNVIYAYLSKEITPVDMQEFDWILTDKAGTGEVVSPVTLGGVEALYGKLYTREMGQYIEKWLPSFVDTMIVLLGVQGEGGESYSGLEDILTELVGTSLYTKANLQSILEAIQGLVASLKDSLDAELYDIIVNILFEALDIDLNHFTTYTIADFADGDREAFVTGLVGMFEPLYPILKWLLTGDNLVVLFNTIDGDDAIIIEGAKGYSYGIVPLLEAFDYNASKEGRILSAEEFEATSTDAASLLRNILNPLLDVVDKVLADPVNEIFNVLPGIIYFLNSNGLDTVIKNTANAVFTVLESIKPITGDLDIYELIGFDAKNMNIETLLEELLKGIEEDTGFKFADVAIDAIAELSVGEVIEIENTNNGFGIAYSMKYATGADRVDMVTTVLSAALTFISVPENVVALEGMLEGSLDGDGYKFVCSLLENFSQMAASEGGMDEIMYTVYQIFYAANVAAHSTEDWLAEFNGDYSFLNQLFATSDLAFLRQLEASLGDLLNKFTGDIIDDDEIVPNGFIAFFQKIAEFFKKIGEFFKNLFK